MFFKIIRVLIIQTPMVFLFCVDLCDLWEKYSRAVWPIQHSQHSSPKSTLFFPVAPRPASKYAILSAFSQLSNNQPFTIRALPRHLPNTPFPTTKRHLPTLDPCPFEAPSLTFRPSIPKPPQPDTCLTPAPPSAYGLSTRPHSASQTSKPRLPDLCFTQNPAPTFLPNIFTLRSQSPPPR